MKCEEILYYLYLDPVYRKFSHRKHANFRKADVVHIDDSKCIINIIFDIIHANYRTNFQHLSCNTKAKAISEGWTGGAGCCCGYCMVMTVLAGEEIFGKNKKRI